MIIEELLWDYKNIYIHEQIRKIHKEEPLFLYYKNYYCFIEEISADMIFSQRINFSRHNSIAQYSDYFYSCSSYIGISIQKTIDIIFMPGLKLC